MCGIAGIVGWNGRRVERSEIEAMTNAVAHRGPDGVGTLLRDGVALGHRRLAIIDLATGQQPMSNEDETVYVTYNGELYNFVELRAELVALGHSFRTRSDTEVIVHAYEQWGRDCVSRLRGMFAFAIADLKVRRLFAARDHFGIKPFYYRLGADYFAFASELRALRRVADAPPEGSLRAVDLFLKLEYIPPPQTIFENVHKLPPASTIDVSFDGRIGEVRRYWQTSFRADESRTSDEWNEEFEVVVRESVRAHTIADVPYGVFLSGGIDSTLVAMNLARVVDRPVHAFNIDFDDATHSERRFAEQAAARIGVTLVSEIVGEPTRDELLALVAQYGEPFGDSSSIPTFCVSRLARAEVPMVLSGDGGDELFGGYTKYDWWLNHQPRLRQYAHRLFERPSRDSLRRLALAAIWRATGRRGNRGDEWQRLVWNMGDVQRHRFWKPGFRSMVFEPVECFEQAAARIDAADELSFAQQMDVATYLPSDILTKVDIASMAHGLEVRTPLIDLRVCELASRLPLSQRSASGRDGAFIGKLLPKRAVASLMGEPFVNRPKQGFAVPRARWFMPGMRTRATFDALLSQPDARLQQWFDLTRVAHAAAAHRLDQDMTSGLWLFLVLALWLEQNPEINFG